jgi:hypothetical protein
MIEIRASKPLRREPRPLRRQLYESDGGGVLTEIDACKNLHTAASRLVFQAIQSFADRVGTRKRLDAAV